MNDIETRLADIERRLQRLELTGVRPVDPLLPPQNQPFASTTMNLLFWLGLVILGVIIWGFSSRLSN